MTGGRYDHLLSQFGKEAPAIGFAVNLDKLMVALVRQHIEPVIEENKIMILYEADYRAKAISYTKELRDNNESVMMVRKRSNHTLEEYENYACRYDVKKIVFITENDRKEITVKR